MLLQLGNLVQLTLLGFFMIWEIEFVDYSYLKLIAALLVLYLYKAYRISVMQKLVFDMTTRCSITRLGGSTLTTTAISCASNIEGSNISSNSHHHFHQHHHQASDHIPRPTFTISVQQPEATITTATTSVGNVKQESSAW